MSHRLSIFVILMSVLAGLATSSCGSSRSVSTVSGHGKGSHSVVSHPSLDGLSPTAKTLISEADSWVGTPYRYGGNDRGGVDCSGFVTQVYLMALGIKLPRSSREQSEYCHKIDKSRLTPGDLLFFRTTKGSNRVSHVGIFVGDNRMIHSSTSRGVIYTDITSDYYARAYAGAGKVESYHALLAKDTKQVGGQTHSRKKKNEKNKKKTPEEPNIPAKTTTLTPEPTSVASSAPSEPKETTPGYTLTPVSSLPSRTTAQQQVNSEPPKSASSPITVARTTPSNSPSSPASAPITEPSPEDAREAVLNSIIEKDLK